MLKYFFISVLVLAAIITLSTFYADRPEVFSDQNVEQSPASEQIKKPTVQIDEAKFFIDLVKTDSEKQKGLSGKSLLEAGTGMLFIYQKADKYTFWMPDMRFPIDIVWINEGKVIDIDENVSNKFDPQNPHLYSPDEPAQYVLEINAGAVKTNNIKIGDSVIFENIK